MPARIEKSALKIKEQLEFWYLKYYNKEHHDFNGDEDFALFDKVEGKGMFMNGIHLNLYELPVFLLRISEDDFIVNTTENFFYSSKGTVSCLPYEQFVSCVGFKEVEENTIFVNMTRDKVKELKKTGFTQLFGFQCADEEIIYWEIPTGEAGFGFWNVVNRCALIGKKYIISDYLK